jgi:protein-tyrosine phosphatase
MDYNESFPICEGVMRRISPYNLWIGNVGDVSNLRLLYDEGIVAIVDLASNEPIPRLNRDFVYTRFPIMDGEGTPTWMLRMAIETIVKLIEANKNTFVYCSAGISRSPAIVAGSLALVNNYTPEKCIEMIAQYGHCDITPGLWKEIVDLLTHWSNHLG